ncbi:hypothetical protein [Morganella morganii]|uniref:hypothetical protein n=1 Tax=Morganella morganii TaxID=582 RepID=UPI000FDC0E8F|nr:hypothetical protein [Morganella morganii]EKU4288324.1 hypothetical protein [Morganella morganii]EKU4302429.1 hypothetical protein [Morganella morganii]EKU5662275.1 hypothetical protein [Morganella morganii]EKU5690165.1 hypothetical protein [Morganella morganii]EKY1475495.1 hypothetical protein [Morganella morganii]
MTDKTGGSAFPMLGSVAYNSDWDIDPGMTLRDYFAAKAMQGIITTAAAPILTSLAGLDDDIAKTSYELADAMLRAREK